MYLQSRFGRPQGKVLLALITPIHQCQKNLFLVDVQTYFVGTFFMVIFLFERHFQIWTSLSNLDVTFKFGRHFQIWTSLSNLDVTFKFGRHFQIWTSLSNLDVTFKFERHVTFKFERHVTFKFEHQSQI